MQSNLVRVAVAAVIASAASAAANATAYTIHISGASAQRTFWEQDLSAIVEGIAFPPSSAIPVAGCSLIKTAPTLNPQVPDLHSYTCTVPSPVPAALPSGVNAGDTITMNYEAEFGSVWGIAPFIPGSNAATTGRRSVTNATVSGYSRDKDTATSGLSAPTAVDIGVSDAEPIFWALPDNWPVSDGTVNAPNGTGTNHVISILSVPGQGQPTLAQLQTLESGWSEINGEVFSVVVNNSAAPTNGITNLSTQSLRSIFTGQYTNWSQVPEVGSGGAIVVCRRDHGSGTQVTSSLYFTQTECGGNNGSSAGGTAVGAAPRFVSTPQSAAGVNEVNLSQSITAFEGLGFAVNPIENFSSNDITACLNAYPGVSIGIRSLAASSSYTTINIDNVQANAHNAAFGAYPFAITTWAFNNTPNSQPTNAVAQSLSSTLISDAQRGTRGILPKEAGTISGGVWTSSAPSVVYGIQDGAVNAKPTFAANTANPSFPVAVWKTTPSKSSCLIPVND